MVFVSEHFPHTVSKCFSDDDDACFSEQFYSYIQGFSRRSRMA